MSYKIYLPVRHEDVDWYLSDFWPQNGPYSPVADLNIIPGQPEYWQSGFLSFQFALDSLFLKVNFDVLDVKMVVLNVKVPNVGLKIAFLTLQCLFLALKCYF